MCLFQVFIPASFEHRCDSQGRERKSERRAGTTLLVLEQCEDQYGNTVVHAHGRIGLQVLESAVSTSRRTRSLTNVFFSLSSLFNLGALQLNIPVIIPLDLSLLKIRVSHDGLGRKRAEGETDRSVESSLERDELLCSSVSADRRMPIRRRVPHSLHP